MVSGFARAYLTSSLLMALAAARRLMVIGKVVEKLAPKVSRVEVQTNELDPHLKMYHGRYNDYKVDDGPYYAKVGDYVLMREKVNPERIDLIYEVSEVVHRAGQLHDLVTNKRIVVDLHDVEFLEDIRHVNGLLPDHLDHQNLKYSEEDRTTGVRQSARDKSGDPTVF